MAGENNNHSAIDSENHVVDLEHADQSTRALRRWLYPDGKSMHLGRASKLKAWLREHNVREFSFTFFLRAAGFLELRVTAAANVIREDDN